MSRISLFSFGNCNVSFMFVERYKNKERGNKARHSTDKNKYIKDFTIHKGLHSTHDCNRICRTECPK